MSYLVDAWGSDTPVEEWNARRRAYRDYLDSIRDRLPEGVYEYATGDKSLHDSWLRSLTIEEESSPEELQDRWINMHMSVLGDRGGDVEFTYRKVRSYKIEKYFHADSDFFPYLANQAHNDWLVDEIRLTDDGFVVHEILFWVAHWLIECESLQCRWLP